MVGLLCCAYRVTTNIDTGDAIDPINLIPSISIISLTDAGMASELLSNNMRLLSDHLQIKEVDFDLLQAHVITNAELQEINAQSKERGDMAGIRCLLLKLLCKSEGQKAAFFACLKERQADLYSSLQRTRVQKHEDTRADEEEDQRETSHRHQEGSSLHGEEGLPTNVQCDT